MRPFISPAAIAALCGVLPPGTYKGNRKKTTETVRKKTTESIRKMPGKVAKVVRDALPGFETVVDQGIPWTPRTAVKRGRSIQDDTR